MYFEFCYISVTGRTNREIKALKIKKTIALWYCLENLLNYIVRTIDILNKACS